MWRSEPHTPVASTRTIASSRASSSGSGRSSIRTSPGAWKLTACMEGARYNVRAVIHALVMIKAEREAMHSLGGKLADVEGVTEAFSVTGEWDFVAIMRLRQAEELAELVTGTLSRIRGIRETHTMVAFEVYSQHDLESLFSIGA